MKKTEAQEIPVKYRDRTIVPCCVFRDKNLNGEFLTKDGFKVKIRLLGTYNTNSGMLDKEMNLWCMRYFSMPFYEFNRACGIRFPIDGWYDRIEMVRI